MKKAVDGGRPMIYGDGRQTRDFVFVKDVVQANILAARSSSAAGNTYNVGTGHSIEIGKLWAGMKLGYKPEISMLAGLQLTFNWYKNKI